MGDGFGVSKEGNGNCRDVLVLSVEAGEMVKVVEWWLQGQRFSCCGICVAMGSNYS